MTLQFRLATLFLFFLFAAPLTFAVEPTAGKSFPSEATPPERGVDGARRSAMVECPAGSGAYCPISADCLCIDKECMCVKPEPRDRKKSTEIQDTHNECKSNCRDTFDSELGACNMHDWDPLGTEYKACVRFADNNYSACLSRCKDIQQ
jgi:hypothetical protein